MAVAILGLPRSPAVSRGISDGRPVALRPRLAAGLPTVGVFKQSLAHLAISR